MNNDKAVAAAVELKWYENQDWSVSGVQAFLLIERHAEDWDEIGAALDAWLKVRTRQPALGELSDEQWGDLVRAASSAATHYYKDKANIKIPDADYDAVIAKAAREFLGKGK